MSHGIVDVFAYQEALLIEAVFGVALLTMLWIGFRRWLQHKEKMSRLIAEQAAEAVVQHGAQMRRVEERLKAIEHLVAGTGVSARIDAPHAKVTPDPISTTGEVRSHS